MPALPSFESQLKGTTNCELSPVDFSNSNRVGQGTLVKFFK
jgi:hypothetical protein